MDCIVHGVARSWTQLNGFHFLSMHKYIVPHPQDEVCFLYMRVVTVTCKSDWCIASAQEMSAIIIF